LQLKTKALILTATTVVIFLFTLIPQSAAAGSITLSSSSQAPGGTITITGTGFSASKTIGIGLGSEITVTGEAHTPTGSGTGPWMTRTNHYPIKPGSFSFHSNVVDGAETDFTDKGDGTMSTTSAYDAGSYLNYATGSFGRSSTMDLSSSTVIFTAAYKYYQYNVTMPANSNSTASGTFSIQVTLPTTIPNGNYVLTALDTAGNTATANLTVDTTIPEGFPFYGILLLSALAVISAMYLRKGIKIVK
jgi:hypothetical protein